MKRINRNADAHESGGENATLELNSANIAEMFAEEGDSVDSPPPPIDTPVEADTLEITDEPAAPITPADPANPAVGDAEPVDELVVPILDDEPKDNDDITNFADWAEDLGITPPKNPDDYEEFKKNFNDFKTAERAAGRQEASEISIEKFDPKVRDFVKAISAGATYESLIEPAKAFNEVLALKNNDLVESYLTDTLKLPKEQVESQMAVFEKNGMLDLEATKIRRLVEGARDAKMNELLSSGAKAFDAEQKRKADERIEEDKSVIAELRSRKEFMGAALSDQHFAVLQKKWENGTYRKAMSSNPQDAVDFMLWKEFGKQRTDKIVSEAKKDGKLGVIKKLSSTGTQQSGAKVVKQNTGSESDQNELALNTDNIKEMLAEK